MNVQAHITGQMHMQNLSGQSNPSLMDPEVVNARNLMRDKICEILLRKQSQPIGMVPKKLQDISTRLEEGLFNLAATKEEYMNVNTLESRLHALIKRVPHSQHQQNLPQHSQLVNACTSVATMTPPPRIQHSSNSNLTVSSTLDSSTIATTRTSSVPSSNGLNSLLSGSSHTAQGSFSNGYQQSPTSFSMNSSVMSSQRVRSQMMPTPVFSSNNNHTVMNIDNTSNVGPFSNVNSCIEPQQVPQKHGQNSDMLQNYGSGMRSLMQQRFQNSSVNSGFGSKLEMVNGSGSSDRFLNTASFGVSSRPSQQPLDQNKQSIVHGDGYKLGSVNSTGSFYNSATEVGSLMNNPNLNQVIPQSITTTTSISNTKSNMLPSKLRPHLAEQIKESSHFQPCISPKYGLMQPTIKTHHLQSQQFVTYNQQKQSNHHQQAFLTTDAFAHPHAVLTGNHPIHSEMSSFSSGSQDVGPTPMQDSHKMSDGTTNDFSLSDEQNLQEDFRQRMVVNDEAECNNKLSSDIRGKTAPHKSTSENPRSVIPTGNGIRERNFKNQLRWLLFLRHARWCKAPEGKCLESNCSSAQMLLKHMDGCTASPCTYPRCYLSKRLLHHHANCRDLSCPVCVAVRNFVRANRKVHPCSDSSSGSPGLVNGFKPNETVKASDVIVATSESLQPCIKRLKAETMFMLKPCSTSLDSRGTQQKGFEMNEKCLQIKTEMVDLKAEITSGLNPCDTESKDLSFSTQQEQIKVENDGGQVKREEVTQASENGAGTKSGKPAIKGVSLMELFTPEQIRDHITGLKQWVGQSKAKVEKNQAMERSMSENSCQLCAVEKLTFEPPPIYCSPCGARIKRNAMYYTVGAGDTRHFFCIPCYNESRGDAIMVDGTTIPKARLEKKRNDEETEEWWVQCDKCEAWQHQICALFNGRRNDSGQAEYTCPNCYIEEVERGERMPLPQSAVLGAKDLPRTILSDHIEQRLSRRLKHERLERARVQGKSYDEVPGAEEIVVRVVSSVDKKLEVKPQFLDIFREENYPTEFPYKSKVVLLFQKIEGVEVCLFGMYVQEFGSECLPPNQRRVYLSYLDSVKYFRPDIRTVTGEALRTFVYHEILIGYLEYCKLRGFTSCYIWACPPLKGEDYILYCHPEIQKTPKSDKLREWYLSMLRKASKENIVVDLTNLYDHFFLQSGECKAKVTAARLPYFDGDYWPGAAEDMIYQMNQEEEGRKLNKKGTTKKMISKRALKASGQSDLSTNASKDVVLMHKLGETISPMKEDFIMVHLQHACTHCCLLMVSGNRWVCNQCKNFQLCDKCFEAEQKRDDRERHPTNQKDKHALYRFEIAEVAEDTKDKDEILESEFFDTRQAFLSLCQGNHYQYDTLRRAKHSSMMVLYHLHNPTAPAFVTTCCKCHLDIETGQGWRCETCPDYDICNACYQKDGGVDHPHKLTNHPSLAERDAQNKEARQLRVLQLRKMLDLLVHASQCRSPHCQYPNCRKVKGLFRHGIQCKVRASGGCVLCKKMWYLLQLHARSCKESKCHVPRCRDLNEHLRRLQQQSDSRRRAAVMEMMRQRTAEVSGNAT